MLMSNDRMPAAHYERTSDMFLLGGGLFGIGRLLDVHNQLCLRLVLVRPSLVAWQLTAIQVEIVYIHLIRGEVMEGNAVRGSTEAALFLEAVYLLILLQLRAKQQTL